MAIAIDMVPTILKTNDWKSEQIGSHFVWISNNFGQKNGRHFVRISNNFGQKNGRHFVRNATPLENQMPLEN